MIFATGVERIKSQLAFEPEGVYKNRHSSIDFPYFAADLEHIYHRSENWREFLT